VNITTIDVQLFEILKQKIGEKEAEALVGFVDSKLRENNDGNLKILATKEDIAKLKGELETKIAEAKADTIKSMFIFSTVSILTTLAGMSAFLKVFLAK
jgi:hypothetical protein